MPIDHRLGGEPGEGGGGSGGLLDGPAGNPLFLLQYSRMAYAALALGLLGGHGFMRDHPVEKWYRDAKVFQIWEGTNEIQRNIIAQALAD